MKRKLSFLAVLFCWLVINSDRSGTVAASERTAWCGDGTCQSDGCPTGGPESPCDGCQEDNGCCPEDCPSGGPCNPNWDDWEPYAYMGYGEVMEDHWQANHWDCYMKEANIIRRQDQNQCEEDQYDCIYFEMQSSRIHDAQPGDCANEWTPPSVGTLVCPY